MFKKIANWIAAREKSRQLDNWFIVTWDDVSIFRDVSPPGKTPWSDMFRWADIERICFKANDYMDSDDMYFFTKNRAESYVIPTEAKGGNELWDLVLEKKLFDPDLATEAVTSVGGLYCWPPAEPTSLN